MQRRLRDWQDPLLSFDHNSIIQLGAHRPGRFFGFDTMVGAGTLTVNIAHTQKGFVYKDPDENTIGPVGAWMTTQGVMITEDAPITALALGTNAANPFQRIDLLVANLEYIEIPGGIDADYSIIQGADGGPVEPGIGDFQVIIGRFYINPSATDLTGVSYVKAPPPDSGDEPDAHLALPNNFTAINENGYDGNNLVLPEQINAFGSGNHSLWGISNKGNTFELNPTAVQNVDGLRIVNAINQDGAEVNLMCNANIRFRANINLTVDELAAGYRPILFGDNLKTAADVYAENIPTPVSVLQPNPGTSTRYCVNIIRVAGIWFIKSVQGINFGSASSSKICQLAPSAVYDELGALLPGGHAPAIVLTDNTPKSFYPILNENPVRWTDDPSVYNDSFTLDTSGNKTILNAVRKCKIQITIDLSVTFTGMSGWTDPGATFGIWAEQTNAANGIVGAGAMVLASNFVNKGGARDGFDGPARNTRIIQLQAADIWVFYSHLSFEIPLTGNMGMNWKYSVNMVRIEVLD